ncbi:16S rRNA (uracil(1498)-N(3))-methyltransferase [Erythrobacter sp. QSSC1-22B]|uniref:16S rRNA (uracil(1498)-N(3))-methyltransferase n=1 Tax=Erythrobacter sp. QSSC1-22B TaxID=1860125 RepID=UPI000804FCEC|nr:16S rRNA (uracil(1498)-N(3))-methyltransferase [Erythrobacter sp. QSSC1-22B]OBX18537.1 16S rRNA (uracil(1498)-N(3))-methyltransferase [Erythrobacter sp. QSSC1-22B]
MPATPAWPPKSAPRLFVADTLHPGAQVTIEGPQAHYLSRVMRVGAGDPVVLCDDATGEWAARVVEAGKRSVALEAVELLREREMVPDIWLCPALIKKDRFDLVLEKATELGVARIAPVVTRRCVADKLNPERARAIVTEASEQCARTALPELAEPVKLAALLADWPETRALYFADENGGMRLAEAIGSTPSACAGFLIGPEGGFDDQERAAIRALPQAVPVSLGPRILRAETAALAALAVWMALAGDWTDRDTHPDRGQ